MRTAATIDPPDTPLRITEIGGPTRLRLAGEIDPATHARLRAALGAADAAGGAQVVIDMAAVSYCDVAGLRAIVELARELAGPDGQRAGCVSLTLSAYLRNVLRILGWDDTPGLRLSDGEGSAGD